MTERQLYVLVVDHLLLFSSYSSHYILNNEEKTK